MNKKEIISQIPNKIKWEIFMNYFQRFYYFKKKPLKIHRYMRTENYFINKLNQYYLIPNFETTSPYFDAFLREYGIQRVDAWKTRHYTYKRNPNYEEFLCLLDVAREMVIEWNAQRLTKTDLKNVAGTIFFLSNTTKGKWSNRIQANINVDNRLDVNFIEKRNEFMNKLVEDKSVIENDNIIEVREKEIVDE